MLERISKLIKTLKLSSSQFADEIGVQRSSVSHVLSGRNKPSLDFVTKILEAYNEVDPDWLLTGAGTMFRDEDRPSESSTLLFEEDDLADSGHEHLAESENRIMEESQRKVKRKTGSSTMASGRKDVNKIVLFYSDGTFREYHPGD